MVLPFVPWRKPSALVEGRCARLAVITALVLCLPPLPPITPPRPNITCLCSARYTHVASISRIGGCCKLASCHPLPPSPLANTASPTSHPVLPYPSHTSGQTPTMAATPADPEDLFTKLERIGKGSFGEVFKG